METARGLEPGDLRTRVKELVSDMGQGDPAALASLQNLVRGENPIDVARILSDLGDTETCLIFDLLATDTQGIVLSEAQPREQALLLMHVGDRGSDLISSLDPDDAADVLEAVEEPEREALLQELDEKEAKEIRVLRTYDPETAGGIMTPEVLVTHPGSNSLDILELVRGSQNAETINTICVCEGRRLVGVLSIREVILANPKDRVESYMTKDVISVESAVDQEEVIRVMETYHLNAVPVVDEGLNLLGIITSDDALSALEDEASEDVLAMAGAGRSAPTEQSVIKRVKARMPWLLITLGGGLMAAWVLKAVAEYYGQADVVKDTTKLLPLVAGLAGNVGMQSSAVMLRGFATGEIDQSRLRRVVRDEILVAIFNGMLCGLVAGVLALAIMDESGFHRFAATSLSIALACATAGVLGSLIPSLCDYFDIDPAIAAGPFITTLNDILGFTIYMAVCLGTFDLRG